LLRGKAYLCFATAEELAEMRKQQQQAKVPPGYYGRWAIWRDATPEQVKAKLAEELLCGQVPLAGNAWKAG
jgi:glutamyl-tRNA synthetase